MKKGTTNQKRSTGSRNKSTTSSSSSKTKKNTTGQQQTSQEENEEESGQSLLEKLFIDLLKDMYGAEKALVPALTKMQSEATTEELQDAFEDHMYITQKQASRLEKIFSLLGMEPQAEKCEAMEGLIKEANTLLQKTEEGTMTRDAALIIAAQKIEHYEIATYGSLVQLALTLDYGQIASILDKTLIEEEDTDALLTEIAECEVNPLADDEPEESMEIMGEYEEVEEEV